MGAWSKLTHEQKAASVRKLFGWKHVPLVVRCYMCRLVQFRKFGEGGRCRKCGVVFTFTAPANERPTAQVIEGSN